MRLAVDVFDEIVPGRGIYIVSGVPCPEDGKSKMSSTGPEPATRTAFRITKAYEDETEEKEDREPVLYGMPFRLESLMAADTASIERGLLPPTPRMYLASSMKSQMLASRLTNRQLVYTMGRPANPETIFLFERATYDQSYESAEDKHFSRFGVPVESGVPVLLQHQATRQCLLGDPRQVEYTEFGAEHEVVCHTIASTKIVSSLSGREAKGSSIVSVPLEQPENHWIVVKED